MVIQRESDRERQRAGHRSTLVSVVVNLLLTAFQLTVGLFAQSSALVADAIHSLSDLVSDGVVLFVNRLSHTPADAEHPYGHRRFETAASMIIGALLLSVGLGMLWTSFTKLQRPELIPQVHHVALYVALAGVISKELLFRYLLRVATRVQSSMLTANAWHARSDAASSIVVSVGIIANLTGFPLADPLAALVVGLLITRMGWSFFFESFHDLMDRAADDETEAGIRDTILATPGVLGMHDLKTRKLGDMLWVEVDLEMDGSLTINEGHVIAIDARRRVMAAHPVLDVMTHFDPVDIRRAYAGKVPAPTPSTNTSEAGS